MLGLGAGGGRGAANGSTGGARASAAFFASPAPYPAGATCQRRVFACRSASMPRPRPTGRGANERLGTQGNGERRAARCARSGGRRAARPERRRGDDRGRRRRAGATTRTPTTRRPAPSSATATPARSWPRSRRPRPRRSAACGRGSVLIGFLAPLTAADTVRALADAGVTSFAMEAIPRISRAQSMDALSSQATVGGYRAALIAAQELPRFFPMLTTAAGTVRPAKVLVLGAGVAGLQAIATARRLGRDRAGLRRALGGQGADRVARRPLPRARHGPRGRRGRRRLRAPADRRGAAEAARAAGRGDRQDGRGHLDRRRARPPRAAAGHRAGRRRT